MSLSWTQNQMPQIQKFVTEKYKKQTLNYRGQATTLEGIFNSTDKYQMSVKPKESLQ